MENGKILGHNFIDHDMEKIKNKDIRIPYVVYMWANYHLQGEEAVTFKEKLCTNTEMNDLIAQVLQAHGENNKHHLEYWFEKYNLLTKASSISSDGKKYKELDLSHIPDATLVKMCCDWSAVSQERGTIVQDWVKKNIFSSMWQHKKTNYKIKFTDKQKETIINNLDMLTNKNNVQLVNNDKTNEVSVGIPI